MTSRDKLEESERFKQVSQVCALYERTREFEYIRHDTLCVTANLEISTGKVVSPRIRETRTNIDFVEEIDTTLSGQGPSPHPNGETIGWLGWSFPRLKGTA